MSEGLTLFLVLSLVYLSDCFIWLNRQSVIFIENILGRWVVGFANPYAGNDSGGVVRLNFLPPAGRVFCAHLMPVSISPGSIVSYNPQTIKVSSPLNSDIRHYKIDHIKDISREGHEVFIDGKIFCKFGHYIQAERFISLVRNLQKITINEREGIIRKFWVEQLNLDKAKQLYSILAERTKWLNAFSFTLFIILFLISPMLKIFLLGLNLTIILIACLMFPLAIIIAILYFRCYRVLFPEQRAERVIEVIKMVACPPIAIRSADRISDNILSEFSPFLIAHLFLSPRDFMTFAGEAFRCLKYPSRDTSLDDSDQEVIIWQNKVVLDETVNFLKLIKCDPEQFILSPERHDTNSIYYCPRCLEESYRVDSECADCIGVKTLPLK